MLDVRLEVETREPPGRYKNTGTFRKLLKTNKHIGYRVYRFADRFVRTVLDGRAVLAFHFPLQWQPTTAM